MMGTKSSEEIIQYWQQHVEAFKSSGLTREAYSKENGIRVYQLDYWRKKFLPSKRKPAIDSKNQWVPVKISNDPGEKSSSIDLWIGTVRVEIKPGFDPTLLTEIIRAVDTQC